MLRENRKDMRHKWGILLISVLAAAVAAPVAAACAFHTQAAAHRPFSAVRSLVFAAKVSPVKLLTHKAHKRTHRAAQPHAKVRPYVTISLYERTTDRLVLRKQGCNAAKRGAGGILILDFGRPGWNGHTYGTMLFSGRFARNDAITWAMKSYARGYVTCLPKSSKAKITLARGTSNYYPTVPNLRRAGREWAAHTHALGRYLANHGLDARVTAAAADDVEPAWDRGFRRTYNFYRGFRQGSHGVLIYNYGSLDGGAGGIWNVRQAYYVSGGMKYARAMPEIYNHAMARQWAYLSRRSVHFYGKPVQFAGLMTQHASGCSCGLTPAEAHAALVRELAKHPKTRVPVLPAVTNIGSPS
jgi:hypothetical protein